MNEMNAGYYRFPTVHTDKVVFVSEDDLWEVSLNGGRAHRLTNVRGAVTHPHFSPNGERIAFTSTDEGAGEVFVLTVATGEVKQITFNNASNAVTGWSKDGKLVLFRTNFKQSIARSLTIFTVPVDGGESNELGIGPSHSISYQPGKGTGQVLARFTDDIARWKRYKGGTAGVIWIKRDKTKPWTRLQKEITSGLCRPMWIGGRIYFTSDYEGYGELYSCRPTGSDLQRHTKHTGFYVRFATTDGKTIVYSSGGALFSFDVKTQTSKEIDVDYRSPRGQMKRKFPDADRYFGGIGVHPKGRAVAMLTRGKIFNMSPWDGGTRQTGEEQGVRYRLPRFLSDGIRYVVLSDKSGEEKFEIHSAQSDVVKSVPHKKPFGRPLAMKVVPDKDAVVFSNNRYELIWLDLKTGRQKLLVKSDHDRIKGFDISADGTWAAAGVAETMQTNKIVAVSLKNWKAHDITSGEFKDVRPTFDPEGRYLYFVSHRYFEPVYDSYFFSAGFPQSAKPCVVTLTSDTESLFFKKPKPLVDEEDDDETSNAKKKKGKKTTASAKSKAAAKKKKKKKEEEEDKKPVAVKIDFEGIEHRVEAFPVATGRYGNIVATKKDIFWTFFPSEQPDPDEDHSHVGTVHRYSIEDKKKKYHCRGSWLRLSQDREHMLVLSGDGPRLISATSDTPDDDDLFNKKSGWINVDRLVVSVEPRAEWRQMLRESWRLMRDQFWTENLAGVDWENVWTRYSPLVDRLGARSEFSDLVWVMQGELGTSHAYEYGGDYNHPVNNRPGFLGGDFSWNKTRKAYKIDRIVVGDNWDKRRGSPLSRPGANITVGEFIEAIDGRRVTETDSIQALLVRKRGHDVELTISNKRKVKRTVIVEVLRSEAPLRYREWVAENRRKVHEATNGKIGYIHVPDMSAFGFSEFHRSYLNELRRDGLIVDVRYNGGGNVSSMLLEKLARKRIGYDVNRYGKPVPYPSDSVIGPMVALTNESAGSDGDIFSHCFKLMGLGPLIGKRTWGGVVGIWPRHALVDWSITTQPEFSFWFGDVGFGVENHGTDPDIVVEYSPDDYASGNDPQLERGLAEVTKLLKKTKPQVPKFGKIPNLAPPKRLK